MMRVLLLLLTVDSFLLADSFDFQTIEKAKRAYESGEFKRSAELFSTLDKDDPSVAYDRANALYKAGAYDEALLSYEKAKGVDEVQRLHNMGNSYFKKNDLDKAIELYEKALKLKSDKDTKYNLELAKKRKEEEKKKQDKKNQDKKEKKSEDKKQESQKKNANQKKNEEKKKEQDKKKEQEKKQKQENKKKSDEKRQTDDKKKADGKDKSDEKKRGEQNISPQELKDEEMRKKELKHMMKQLKKQKMPTLIYPTGKERGDRDEKNPW